MIDVSLVPVHHQSVNALVVGTTHRYKSKYVTTVMYKPRTRRGGGDSSPS